jgi:hypothetical protein
MGWESRGNGIYYYRKRRVDGRVVSEYVGIGKVAHLISQLELIERDKRLTEREGLKAQIEREKASDQQLDQLSAQLDALVRAVLVADGYHTHKGQWRRSRER